MSAVSSSDELVTKTDLANFYQTIYPYLGNSQLQADWNQSNASIKDYIKNKPAVVVSDEIRQIVLVTALPSDASQHTDTLYLIKET